MSVEAFFGQGTRSKYFNQAAEEEEEETSSSGKKAGTPAKAKQDEKKDAAAQPGIGSWLRLHVTAWACRCCWNGARCG